MGTLLTLTALALSILGTAHVLGGRGRPPARMLAWILAFVLVPFLGVGLYALLGYRGFHRARRRKPDPGKKLQQRPPQGTRGALAAEDEPVAELAEKLTDFPVVYGNRITAYDDAQKTYGAIAHAIREAKHHVHVEYYIFQPDETGAYFRDLLIAQARRGVECRLLFDAVGSWRIGRKFLAPLRDSGVKFAAFGPVRLVRPWGLHLRNHRKLVVVDGKKAFIGSQNIGNEYVKARHRGLVWRDVVLEIEGPGVVPIQTLFAEDWEFTTGERIDGAAYFPDSDKSPGSSPVQIMPTGPDEDERTLEMVLAQLLHSARRRVALMTPYFVPSDPIALALYSAARRGVAVDVLLPKRSDQWVADATARSWFAEILASGARIRLYDRSLLHAKMVIIDARAALIGSANMDERSFRLNFESTALVFDSKVAADLEQKFDDVWSDGSPVAPETYLARAPLHRRVAEGIFKILSPILIWAAISFGCVGLGKSVAYAEEPAEPAPSSWRSRGTDVDGADLRIARELTRLRGWWIHTDYGLTSQAFAEESGLSASLTQSFAIERRFIGSLGAFARLEGTLTPRFVPLEVARVSASLSAGGAVYILSTPSWDVGLTAAAGLGAHYFTYAPGTMRGVTWSFVAAQAGLDFVFRVHAFRFRFGQLIQFLPEGLTVKAQYVVAAGFCMGFDTWGGRVAIP